MSSLVIESGRPISYDVQGSGRPVLFIPGLCERRSVWEPVIQELSGICLAIKYDLRGYTGDEPGDFTIADLSHDAASFLRTMAVGPAAIVGHSEGGFIALELALAQPELVSGVAIISSASYTDEYGRRLLTHWREVAEGLGMKALGREMLLWGFSPGYVNAQRRELRLLESFSKDQAAPLNAYLAHNRACMNYDTRARLPSLTTPTLLMGGTADIVMTLRHNLLLRDLIVGSGLTSFEGFGHHLLAEAPNEICQALRLFLREPHLQNAQ